jgi:hypothetical protein
MKSTEEIYGHPASRYTGLPYEDAIRLRMEDAKHQLQLLRNVEGSWDSGHYARADVLLRAITHNKTLLSELGLDEGRPTSETQLETSDTLGMLRVLVESIGKEEVYNTLTYHGFDSLDLEDFYDFIQGGEG